MPVPGVATTVMGTMMQFITFDILQASDWLSPWLETFDDGTESKVFPDGLNEFFDTNGISSVSFLKNLGSTLVYVAIFALLHLSQPLIQWAGKKSLLVQ